MEWVRGETNYPEYTHRIEEAFSSLSIREPKDLFGKTRDVLEIGENIVDLIEKFTKEFDDWSSKDKLDLAVDFIDEVIELPFYVEWLDDNIIRFILSLIVEQKNKYLGQDWYKD